MSASFSFHPTSIVIAIFLFFLVVDAGAQNAPGRFWVQFEGKEQQELPDGHFTPYTVSAPQAFLSGRSLSRRAAQGIDVSGQDLPIPPSYIEAISAISEVKIILKSKWFNAVTIAIVDTLFDPQSLNELAFVVGVKSVIQSGQKDNINLASGPDSNRYPPTRNHVSVEQSAYGEGWDAIHQLNGEWLHGMGFRGQGKWIAVLDAGFEYTERLPVFQHAWDENRIRSGIDAMQSQGGLFAHHRHGTSVLGTMAGWLPDSLIGTAPDATYLLYRTEDAYSEYLIEEDYWVAAAEHADSAGVDLINTSLGYSLFDDSTMNHLVEELNGTTARISQATSWAADKGILCVTSAGNSGNSPWHFITAPADAENILAVGAVDTNGERAPFSGWGPAADGRIKPEVMALGVQAAYPKSDSTISRGNGTSFSSPIICGMAASLWQAFPLASAKDVRSAILQSAHLYDLPNDSMGHGIPDFREAFRILDTDGVAQWEDDEDDSSPLLLFPNPSNQKLIRWMYQGENSPNSWQLINARGQIIAEGDVTAWNVASGAFQGFHRIDTALKQGAYLFQLLESNKPIAQGRWVYLPQ